MLTPAEVAAMFAVDPKTVTRWAKAGKIPYVRTVGGHRRFPAKEVLKLLGDAGRFDELEREPPRHLDTPWWDEK